MVKTDAGQVIFDSQSELDQYVERQKDAVRAVYDKEFKSEVEKAVEWALEALVTEQSTDALLEVIDTRVKLPFPFSIFKGAMLRALDDALPDMLLDWFAVRRHKLT